MNPKLFKVVSISALAFVAAMSIVNIKTSELSTVKDGEFSNNENTFVTLTPGVDHYFTVGKEGLTFSQLTESGFRLDDSRSVAGYVLTWDDSGKPDSRKRQDSMYYQSNGVWKKFGSRDSFGDERISNYFVIRTLSSRSSIKLNLPTHVTYFGSTKYNSSDRPWENYSATVIDSATSQSMSSGSFSASNTSYELSDLEMGVAHPDVITLQKYLNSDGYIIEMTAGQPGSVGNETNYFGEKTKNALMKFQQDKGIYPVWGFFGPQTKRVMGL